MNINSIYGKLIRHNFYNDGLMKRTCSKNRLKGIRLTSRGKERLKQKYPEWFGYIAEKNRIEISRLCQYRMYPKPFCVFLKVRILMKFVKYRKEFCRRIEQDFSKHAPKGIVPQIRIVWNSIPSQLAKENKKFIYGLVHKVCHITTPHLPLKAYEDLNAFKLFFLDVSLLNCMTDINKHILLDGNDIFKGSVTEQYVFWQLRTVSDWGIYYYTNDRNSCEIDLLVDDGEKVTPVEVKVEENLKAKFENVQRKMCSGSLCQNFYGKLQKRR